MAVAQNYNLENIKSLIKYGANIDYQMHDSLAGKAKQNRTVLMQAAAEGKFEAVEELLRLGANPLLKNAEGDTALVIAEKASAHEARASTTIEKLGHSSSLGKKYNPKYHQTVTILESANLIFSVKNFAQKLKVLQKAIQKNH